MILLRAAFVDGFGPAGMEGAGKLPTPEELWSEPTAFRPRVDRTRRILDRLEAFLAPYRESRRR